MLVCYPGYTLKWHMGRSCSGGNLGDVLNILSFPQLIEIKNRACPVKLHRTISLGLTLLVGVKRRSRRRGPVKSLVLYLTGVGKLWVIAARILSCLASFLFAPLGNHDE